MPLMVSHESISDAIICNMYICKCWLTFEINYLLTYLPIQIPGMFPSCFQVTQKSVGITVITSADSFQLHCSLDLFGYRAHRYFKSTHVALSLTNYME